MLLNPSQITVIGPKYRYHGEEMVAFYNKKKGDGQREAIGER